MTTIEQNAVTHWRAPVLETLSPDGSPMPRARQGTGLRRILVILDVIAATLGWTGAFALTVRDVAGRPDEAVVGLSLVALVALTVAMVAGQQLYLARMCAIRSVEISRVARSMALTAVAALALPSVVDVSYSSTTVITGAALSFVLLNVARSGFRSWLHGRRRQGRFLRSVVVVGANDEGYDLFRLLADHPETGFAVAAIAGESEPGMFPSALPRIPLGDGVVEAIRELGASGVVIASSALHHRELNRLVRGFLDQGIHVHLSSGLRGMDHRRVRSQPLAHEPLFYVERMALSPWQVATKRAVDLIVGSVAALIALPMLALAAIAIKLDDRGPVFYRQLRPGRGEVPFPIVKLRTMRVGADKLEPNRVDPTQGPRAKVDDDPRRTRVGRILERTSIDELPQLWNVLRGEMSLVGPRPALAHEAATFDDELRARFSVRPGMTGLWQVEARDNPSFAAYRRYDLFYIENWSPTLDFAIFVATLQSVALRGLSFLLRRPQGGPPAVRQMVVLDEA